jgi:hypothetical protein
MPGARCARSRVCIKKHTRSASDMAAKYRELYCITWAGSLFSVVPVATLTELSPGKGWDRNTPWPASRW